ncbi:MAG: hydroxyacid dehydrogenase [Verrucomicrobiota bacterium]
MGIPARLAAAYPPAIRNGISANAKILGPDIPGDSWESHLAEIGRAEVIMSTWGMPVLTPDFLAAAPNLRAVFYAAGSVKCFATDEAYEKGVLIFSARMANAIPVAEYAAAAVVLSLKQFWAYSRTVRESHTWSRTIPVAGTYQSTIGLVSLGATGRQTAERLSHLDCNLIAFDPFVQQESARALGVNMVSLEEVFRLSDVVSVHAPVLPETRGMIDGRLLGMMKTGATLINTSRGAVIVEHELCHILQRRPDLTAVLDVTDPEPPDTGSPLFRLPNVVMTPHISGSMDKEIAMMGQWMADELAQYLMDRPLTHHVSRELLAQLA